MIYLLQHIDKIMPLEGQEKPVMTRKKIDKSMLSSASKSLKKLHKNNFKNFVTLLKLQR